MLRQIILDTETTGLMPEKGHRIIEIACLEMINRRITGSTFHRYTNPQRDIEQEAIAVHGITVDLLKDKPLFREIIDEFIQYIDGAELIIHNAPFDINFLNHEFNWAGKRYKNIENYCSVFDTLSYARRKHPGQHNSLDALCRRYHVDNTNRELHSAVLDAELLAHVYLLMTGGQGKLFQGDTTTQTASETQSTVKRLDSQRSRLPVTYASELELMVHQEFLKQLIP